MKGLDREARTPEAQPDAGWPDPFRELIEPPVSTRRETPSRGSGAPMHEVRIKASVVDEIRRTVGSLPAEQGGALGGDREIGCITHFYFDRSARRTGATYSPDYRRLNRLFRDEWNPAGVNLLGIVHSHPPGARHPSGGDMVYAGAILAGIPELDRLVLPIVVTEPDSGRFELLPFAAVRDGDGIRIEPLRLVVEPDDSVTEARDLDAEIFRRVVDAYDLARLRRSRVICIGAGGAAGFIEDLARCGVGEFVLIDADEVSTANVGTQQVYIKDVGRPKVEVIAERLLQINPRVHVVPLKRWLDDLDDAEFRSLACRMGPGREPPIVSLICGLTDRFEAQARVNRLALQLGLPSLCAQVYHQGRGAEITFTYPGVTPACHRCALSSRYDAYLAKGFRNDVTSDATPIFATTRLNALKGFIALALLHHGTDHPRWGRLLERIGARNLIQIRMDPDLRATIGLTTFDRVLAGADGERLFFDDAVWLPQDPDRWELNERPTCPECQGSGDLRNVIDTFIDTRVMLKGEPDHAAIHQGD